MPGKPKTSTFILWIMFLFLLCSLISIACLWYSIKAYDEISTIADNIERTDAFAGHIKKNFTVHGRYFSDKYYCVWTEGRSEQEIAKTDEHEVCHALINEDYDHFCK